MVINFVLLVLLYEPILTSNKRRVCVCCLKNMEKGKMENVMEVFIDDLRALLDAGPAGPSKLLKSIRIDWLFGYAIS